MSWRTFTREFAWVWVAICWGVLAAAPGWGASREQADLYLWPNVSGATALSLSLGLQPLSSASVERAVSQALGGPLRQVEWQSENGAWTLSGRCDAAFPLRGGIVRGQVDPAPLLPVLRKLGMQWLTISITHPRAGFSRCPGAQRVPAEYRSSVAYFLPVAVDEGSPPLQLTYGYRRADWLRAFVPPLLILLLPVGLSVWARRAVGRAPEADPAAIWFGYWRLRRGLSGGTFLAWLTTLFLLKADVLIGFALGGQRMAVQKPVEVGIALLPPLLVAAACSLFLYPAFARVRQSEWTRADVARQSAWGLAANIIPLLLVCAMGGAMSDGDQSLAVLYFAAGFATRILFLRRWMSASGLSLNALTVGELRDRVFALAQKAGVKVQQIYVLPAGKARLANAFAMQGQNVLLTDYLLQHLSRREVDAIVAHELAHLKRRDPLKLSIALAVSVAVPVGLYLGLSEATDLDSWRPVVPSVIALALLGFYFLSRRIERGADAGAIALTGEPEALITGLARSTSLNTMPMQWGKWEERFLTHPSTTRRAQAIARRGGITADRLQAILSAPDSDPERYPIPPSVVDQGTLFSTSFKSRILASNSWTLIAVMVLTPACTARLVLAAHLTGMAQGAAYLGGLVATLGLYLLAANYVPLRGYGVLRQRLRQKLEREEVSSGGEDSLFVSFAPAPTPRIYEGFYDWDVGFLRIKADCIEYTGEQVRFALRRDQVIAVRLDPGGPGWLRAPRLCITWRDEAQAADRAFTMRPITAGSMREIGREARSLAKQLQAWREQPSTPGACSPAMAGWGSPDVGEVTSFSPRALLSPRTLVRSLLFVAVLAAGASMLLGLPFDPEQGEAGWYAVGVALLAWLFQWVPYFMYREPQLNATPSLP